MSDTDIASVSTFRQSEPALETQTIVSARLASEQSLAVFRSVLDAASRPGRIGSLPDGAAPGVPPAIVPVLALADLDVSVEVLDSDAAASWQSLVRSVTGCRIAAAADADNVIALRPPTVDEIRLLRSGTDHAPERGARLFIACDAIRAGRNGSGTSVRVHGPGASNGRTVTVDGIESELFAALSEANRSFPAGVDTWLIAANRDMVAFPRSTHIGIIEGVD